MNNCLEYKRLSMMIKEADAIFLKIDSAVVNQLKTLIKDNDKEAKSNKLSSAEDPFKRSNLPINPLSRTLVTIIGFMAKKTPISLRESNEEAKNRGFGRRNNKGAKNNYPTLNPLILDGKTNVL